MKKYLLYFHHLYAFAIIRPLYQEIIARGDHAAIFLGNPDYQYLLRTNEVHLETVKDVLSYHPRAVFVAGNTVPNFFSGIKVQVFHGFSVHKRKPSVGHFRIRGMFDLYCTQGPSTTLPFLELEKKHGYFKVTETGWPKVDPLFSASKQKENTVPKVLFASTFTRKLSAAHAIADTVRALSETKSWDVSVTLHPKMDQEIVKIFRAMKQVHFVETDDVIPQLIEADVMLSDTSSILYEFLLLQKPVVTYRNRVPGPHLINVTEKSKIESALLKALQRPPVLMEAIQRYVKNLHPYCDGRSSGRVIDAAEEFIEKDEGRLKRKPFNLFRRLKERYQYQYWRFEINEKNESHREK